MTNAEPRIFSRFKYAEEYANELHRKKHLFRMTNRFDVDHEEDGETYTYDEFIVEDLGQP